MKAGWRYDSPTPTIQVFAAVQNKLHYAIHGQNRLFESDFDRMVKQIESAEDDKPSKE